MLAVDPDGAARGDRPRAVVPVLIDWLPDGRLLIVSARERAVLTHRRGRVAGRLCRACGGSRTGPPGNEIVIDGVGQRLRQRRRIDMLAGEPFAPGMIALVAPTGEAREVAGGIASPTAWRSRPTARR